MKPQFHPSRNRNSHLRGRRGSVLVAVIWAIALGAILTASLQLLGRRQALMSREAVERIQTRWTARAGVENMIAVMTDYTVRPAADDAFAMVRDMEQVSAGRLGQTEYDIRHWRDGRHFAGPLDEHARLNINRIGPEELMLLEDMTIDVASSIADWKDADDEITTFGVERDYYQSLEAPYEPRNANIRSLAELELVAGVWPEYLRGEDWNLNFRLDPNENDRATSWPNDEPDGFLDAGWSEFLTAVSVDHGATASGEPRIFLMLATVDELTARLGVDDQQAEKLIAFGLGSNNRLEQLVTTPLANIGDNGTVNQQPQPGSENVAPLDDDQLLALFQETSVVHPGERVPGRLNINTVPEALVREIVTEEGLADEIIYMRNSQPQGITSMLELRDIPDMEDGRWDQLTQIFDTQSNVYTIVSRGKSLGTGMVVEIIAVVDRSTVPVRILEYREQ